MNFRRLYKNEELSCPLECMDLDTKHHILDCQKIPSTALTSQAKPGYDDLFCMIATVLEQKEPYEGSVVLVTNDQFLDHGKLMRDPSVRLLHTSTL